MIVNLVYTHCHMHFLPLSPSLSLSLPLSPSLSLPLPPSPSTVYSMAPAEVVDPLIYDGLVEELIEVLEVKNPLLQVRYRQSMFCHIIIFL